MKEFPCEGDLGYVCDLVKSEDLDETKEENPNDLSEVNINIDLGMCF